MEDEAHLELVLQQFLKGTFCLVQVVGELPRREVEAAREPALVGARQRVREHGIVVGDECMLVGTVSGDVDGLERADGVTLGVPPVDLRNRVRVGSLR
jgi:hypothetical protein